MMPVIQGLITKLKVLRKEANKGFLYLIGKRANVMGKCARGKGTGDGKKRGDEKGTEKKGRGDEKGKE